MTDKSYQIHLGLSQSKKTGLWHPRLQMLTPEGEVVCNAHIPDGYATREEAYQRLRDSLPDILERLKRVGNDVELLEVV